MKPTELLENLSFIDDKYINETLTHELIDETERNKFFQFIKPLTTCIAIIMLFTVSYSLITPPNNENIRPLTGGDGGAGSTIKHNFTLNRTDMLLSDNKISLNGHFWNKLSDSEVATIFPTLYKDFEIISNVHYSSKDNKATLFQIQSEIALDKHKHVSIIIAPNNIEKCYFFEEEPILSDINGITIEAGLYVTNENNKGDKDYVYFADFKIADISYYIEFVSENIIAENDFINLISDIILAGAVDLSVFDNPIIPTIIDKELSEQEAYRDSDFGRYLIDAPNDYIFNSSHRLYNQNNNSLFISWSRGYDDLSVFVYQNNDDSKIRIVSPEQIELYDMTLYDIPWSDSMPNNTRHIIENPIFKSEDINLEIIEKRSYIRSDVGESSSGNKDLKLSVLYGDIVVEIKSQNLSGSYLYNQLIALDISE